MKIKELVKFSSLPVVIASLCCLSPVVLVLLGVSTASFASSLAATLYGEYKWLFRLAGLLALIGALVAYFRKQGICTLDQARREHYRVINALLAFFIAGILGYVFFLYVVVHYAGVWLRLWT